MSVDISLSEREMEVLRLVAEGLTNREIAQKLSISHNTVKVHLSNIFEKIGVASRTEATVYAIERRIVEVPGGEAAAAPAQSGLRDLVRQFRWVWLAIILLLLMIGLTLSVNLMSPEPTPEVAATVDAAERWQSLAPLPEPRVGMAAVNYSGDIYVIGGEGLDGVSADGFRYLPETDEWSPIADKPTAVKEVSAVVMGEKIYVPGGEDVDGQPTDTLEIYDPRQDTWETGENLPVALSNYALAGFEGKMYMFGGWDGSKYLTDVWVFDPVDNVWSAGASLTDQMIDIKALTLSDRIILVGSYADDDNKLSMLAYHPSRTAENENPWESSEQVPLSTSDFSGAVLNDLIFLLSVEENVGIPNTTFLLYKDGNWETKDMVIKDLEIQSPLLIPIGSQLFILLPDMNLSGTGFERYQAFYYEIYIPIIN